MRWQGAGRNLLRWSFWLLMGWVFVRGVVSFLPEPPVQAAGPETEARAPVEPASVRAVAEMFAREYLTWSPGGTEDRAARLRPFLTAGLDRQAGWSPGDNDSGQQVEQTWVYDVQQRSPTRWQVTIAAQVAPYRNETVAEQDAAGGERSRTERRPLPAQTLYLAVPVGKAEGGWVVYDYPSLLPAPEPGAFGEPLFFGQETSEEADRVNSLLTDFFKAYLGGGDVTYYLTPSTALRPHKGSWSFQQLAGLRLVRTADGLWALADVVVQDPASRARYTYRYTVKLENRDGRWYIAELLQKGE